MSDEEAWEAGVRSSKRGKLRRVIRWLANFFLKEEEGGGGGGGLMKWSKEEEDENDDEYGTGDVALWLVVGSKEDEDEMSAKKKRWTN